MEIKTYIISIVIVWLTVVVTEYIGHHLIFSRVWKKFGKYPPVEEIGSDKMSWNLLAALIFSVVFVQLYTLNFIGTGPTVGLQFGLLIGCIISIPRLLHQRAHSPLRWELEIISPFITIAESGFSGILVAWMFQ
ncbi:MAG: hypothetical protein ABSB78_10890 [Bacteroidota bacterium]